MLASTICWTNKQWMSIYKSQRGSYVNVPSQWKTTLHCNVVFHWLSACTLRFLPEQSMEIITCTCPNLRQTIPTRLSFPYGTAVVQILLYEQILQYIPWNILLIWFWFVSLWICSQKFICLRDILMYMFQGYFSSTKAIVWYHCPSLAGITLNPTSNEPQQCITKEKPCR